MIERDGEHAVYIRLRLSNDDFGARAERVALMQLEQDVERALADSSVGQFDGHEVGGGWHTLVCYGDDADAVYAAIEPIVASYGARPGSQVVKQYGEPGPSTIVRTVDLPGAGD